jgi:tetratricopeptide (TPR) repeat protein
MRLNTQIHRRHHLTRHWVRQGLAVGLAALGIPLALAGQSSAPAHRALLDSLRPVIERSLASADWSTLERATQRLRVATSSAAGRTDPWVHYDLAYALHRRASALTVEEKPREARGLLEESIKVAQQAQALGAQAHAKALEGAVTGQLAGVAGGLSAMRFGPRSFKLLDEAMEALPNDPRVALLNGISRLNAPRPFGGGPVKGEGELRRALRLYANDPARSPQPVWGLVDAHIWLGIALHQQGKTAEARAEFQRALEVVPGHRWVTDQLLPALTTGK